MRLLTKRSQAFYLIGWSRLGVDARYMNNSSMWVEKWINLLIQRDQDKARAIGKLFITWRLNQYRLP